MSPSSLSRALKAAPFLLGIFAASATACSSSTDTTASTAVTEQAVVKAYANILHESYEGLVADARAMKVAIDAFVDAPSEATLEAAKKAWIKARASYGPTEAYRFYGGPIDAEETGPEGRINGWPLDENFVDYTKDAPEAGIINKTTDFPTITKELISEQNEKGGEKNLSAGWHAIEFLLWGQDLSTTGPGARPYTDYVKGSTAKNPERRGQYLKAVTELLVDDLDSVEVQWDTTGDTYAVKFLATPPLESISKILTGLGSLSGAELSRERMNNAYETKEQEEEHSCFSDNTLADLAGNAQGIQNVYTGNFGKIAGPGIGDLVKAKDPALDTRVRAELAASIAAIKAIPAPFDQAILGDDAADGRKKIKAAMDSLKTLTQSLVDVAKALNVQINTDPK